MHQPIAWYREFLPCTALQRDVSALFSFVASPPLVPPPRVVLREIAFHDASFCSPQFADGHVSIVFELGRTCDSTGWFDDPRALGGTAIGPMTGVGRMEGNSCPEMIGAYFRPGGVDGLLPVPLSELADRSLGVEDVWGTAGALASELRELDEADRLVRLESILLSRLGVEAGHERSGSVDVRGVAMRILRTQGRWSVGDMASAAGVSRQHLTREFRQRMGISPKLYSRVARFHSALAYASTQTIDWADAAVAAGYADQSHMIAEFRQFSGLTPHALARGHWFHPFIERAKARMTC